MSKKILMLALSLVALAGALTFSPATPAEAAGTVPCPRCTYYADGSKCCVSCICNASTGIPVACTNHYCPPAGGGDNN